MAKAKRIMIKAEDLYRIELITDLRISPDARNVVYTIQRVDRKTEKKYSNIWIVPTKGGKPKQFTYGNHSDYLPRWSPCGRFISFMSNRHDETDPQIYIIPFDGGEARKVTSLKGSFAGIQWFPDGKKFLVNFRSKDKDVLEREANEQKKKLGVVSRHITNMFFKMDGAGYIPKGKWHLWTVDAKSGKAAQLTKGDKYDEGNAVISPDGSKIAFVSNRADNPELDYEAYDIWVMPSKGGKMKLIPTPPGQSYMPSWSPDGKWLAYLGQEGKGEWYRNTRVWVVPSDAKGKAKCLSANHDLNCVNWTVNDLVGAHEQMPPTWMPDMEWICFQVAYHGDSVLKRVNFQTGEIEDVLNMTGVIGTFNTDPEHHKLAYFHTSMTDPGQIFVRDNSKGTTKKLTKLNESWMKKIDFGEIEEVWFKGSDRNDLQGWIIKPPGFNPKKKYPSILEIHGGPRVQYGNMIMHEFFYLAAAGYVVYFCNPRGGQGYGEAHSGTIVNDWGNKDYKDLMKWTDFAAKKPYIDEKRMGVTGGSYGGYMTGWIVGHTNRFKAAVAQRMVSNLISMWGSSDMNWIFQDEFGKKPPFENYENFWRQSPIKYAGNVKTPTLVIHSESDFRCAIEQGEQFYIALKKQGIDTELVRFPDEPHGLSRGGRTDRRIARLEHIKRWFDKYM